METKSETIMDVHIRIWARLLGESAAANNALVTQYHEKVFRPNNPPIFALISVYLAVPHQIRLCGSECSSIY